MLLQRRLAAMVAVILMWSREPAGASPPRLDVYGAPARVGQPDIETITGAVRALLATDHTLRRNFNLLVIISGIGQVTAVLLLAELPNIDDEALF